MVYCCEGALVLIDADLVTFSVFQVVEIAGLTDHLLTECDQKDKFKKCPRCTEAIADTEFDQHVAEKTCPRKQLISFKKHEAYDLIVV